ncbi:F/Y-rich N-terminus-domain-containing protein [Dichotomocladium elegans]|nr:F/Y-rich N-terminus-domain-containing protein [Dichotomocladium elegans]
MEVMYQDGRMVPSSRPKRMRRGPVEPKVRRVQPLEKDPVSGEYKLPARVGILTVHALGRVVPLPSYHNDRYIWPVGFKVSRTYLSMMDPNVNTVYTCSVEDNGEQGPRFRVVADDCPDQPIVANSATGVWTAIVKRANEIRNRDHSNSGKTLQFIVSLTGNSSHPQLLVRTIMDLRMPPLQR